MSYISLNDSLKAYLPYLQNCGGNLSQMTEFMYFCIFLALKTVKF